MLNRVSLPFRSNFDHPFKKPRGLADEETRKLRILVGRRYQLIQMMTSELNRQSHSLAALREGFTATIRCFKKQIAIIDKQVLALIQAAPDCAQRQSCFVARLGSAQLHPRLCSLGYPNLGRWIARGLPPWSELPHSIAIVGSSRESAQSGAAAAMSARCSI
jgi:hypothetical protein